MMPPVMIQWCSDADAAISPHFKAGEFRCRDADGPWPVAVDLVVLLERIRDRADVPVTITSGYRTWAHNRRVGGAADSRHLYGLAADIVVRGLTAIDAAGLAWSLGCRRIGVAAGYIHVDVAPGEALWTYTTKGTEPSPPAQRKAVMDAAAKWAGK